MKNATSRPHDRNKEKNVYQSLEPLYFFTLILGLSPYIYNREYKSSKFLIVYSVLIVISFLAFYRLLIYHPRDLAGPSIISTLDTLQTQYNNALTVICIILACKKHRLVIKSVKRLYNMDQNLKKLNFNVTLNHYNTRWCLTAYLMVLFVATSLLETTNCGLTLRETVPYSMSCWVFCYFLVISVALTECQFLTFVVLLKQRFAELNKYLTELRPKFLESRNVLKDIQVCHAELCDVVRNVNEAFSLQMLLCVGLIFLQGTLNLVHVFQHIKNDDIDWDMWTTIIWAVYYLIRLLVMSYVCELMINEANNTGSLLHNIQVHEEDEDTANTVLMFSKQLIHNRIRLNAYGFFPLDMSLFFSIVAAVAMYLLIMVQMDVVPRDEANHNHTNAPIPLSNDVMSYNGSTLQ